MSTCGTYTCSAVAASTCTTTAAPATTAAVTAEKEKKSPEQQMRTYQELVDAKALVVFPVAFLLFNIGYWLHYLINT